MWTKNHPAQCEITERLLGRKSTISLKCNTWKRKYKLKNALIEIEDKKKRASSETNNGTNEKSNVKSSHRDYTLHFYCRLVISSIFFLLPYFLTILRSSHTFRCIFKMSLSVIFSIVYCMHFIWYFIVAIARSQSEWICSFSRLSNSKCNLKGISCTFHWTGRGMFFLCLFSCSCFFLVFSTYSLNLNLNSTLLKSRSHKTTFSIPFPWHCLLAICISTI